MEDEALVRIVAVETLEDFGFSVLEAGRGDEALAQLTANPAISLLVTDVGLPGLDGRQLAEAARKLRPELPVIFMTGYAPRSDAAPAPDARTFTLGKPFTPDQLYRAVRAMLDA